MILSGQTIRKFCRAPWTPEGKELIEPFVERSVSQAGKSYGLSIAGYDIRVDKFRSGYGGIIHDHVRMQNGDFVLGSSIERFKMPNNIIAFVKDKSSWAREGLAVQNTVLEPGWEGYLTLELSYHRPAHHIIIKQGDPIAQVVFQFLDEPAERLYDGKYQNQPNIPVESIHEQI